jgi:hypothetical protein
MMAVNAGNDDALVQLLVELSRDTELLPLERDEVLIAFIDRLRVMPPASVGPATLQYLLEYRPQAVRPDEHRPVVPVPVHNVGAAAQGLINNWRRQEAAYAGAVLLTRDPSALVQAYALHAEAPVRRGLLSALGSATRGQLEMISFMALSAMDQEPALAELAGEAALLLGDARALEQLVRTGQGSAVTHILRASRQRLSPDQVERLLDTAIEQAAPEVAAVAIAELAPVLAGRRGVEDRLFDLLDDDTLGATAALTLTRNPSDTTLVRLGELIRSADNTLAAKRARLALELVGLQRVDEALP